MKTYHERLNAAMEQLTAIRKARAKKRTARLITAAAVLTLVLFFPLNVEPPNVRAYSDSPYYELIKQIDRANGGEPGYKNLFDAITYKISELTIKSDENTIVETPVEPPVVDDPVTEEKDPYVNLNFADDAIPGLTDGEEVLETEEYIYRLVDNILKVFTRDGGNSKKISEYRINPRMIYINGNYEPYEKLLYETEMFLSEDGTKITVLIPVWLKQSFTEEYILLVQLDISDPENIQEIDRYYASGELLDAWLMDDELLLVTEYYAGLVTDYSKSETYVPTIGFAQQLQPIPAEDIVLTGVDLTRLQYIILYKVDMEQLQVKDQLAVMTRGWYDGLYITEDYLFTAYTMYHTKDNVSYNVEGDIACFHYGDELALVSDTTLSGAVGGSRGTLHMDLYDGVLRLITRQIAGFEDEYSLYCLDVPKLSVISKTENITPGGWPWAVEFKGNYLYFVNQHNANSDIQTPYIYDLSNPKKITFQQGSEKIALKDKLIEWVDGYWLGIRQTENEYQMDIELFTETETGFVSVGSYTIDAQFASGKDTLYIDRERGLLGIYARYKLKSNQANSDWFLLLKYADGQWEECSCTAATNYWMLPQDDWIYLISNNVIKAIPLS